jgi:hypothetical protein
VVLKVIVPHEMIVLGSELLGAIPPGSGGYAQSPSAAKRKEKAHKHASQSAFVIRPAGTSGSDWFVAAVGVTTLLALLLSARA